MAHLRFEPLTAFYAHRPADTGVSKLEETQEHWEIYFDQLVAFWHLCKAITKFNNIPTVYLHAKSNIKIFQTTIHLF